MRQKPGKVRAEVLRVGGVDENEGRVCVAAQVVDAAQRQPEFQRERGGRRNPYGEAVREPRAVGGGDFARGGKVFGLRDFRYERGELFQVLGARQIGHNAAVERVQVYL